MTKLQDIEYPLRLCVEMLHFAGLGANGKTDNMKASEIKNALCVFFADEQIKESVQILTGDITWNTRTLDPDTIDRCEDGMTKDQEHRLRQMAKSSVVGGDIAAALDCIDMLRKDNRALRYDTIDRCVEIIEKAAAIARIKASEA